MSHTAEKAEALYTAAAYHEAGHAACGLYYGLDVGDIRIRVVTGWLSDPEASGETWVDGVDETDPESIASGIVVSYAGPEAESWWWSHYHGISIARARRSYRAGSAGDMRMVAEKLEYLDGDRRRLARHLERESTVVVAEMWDSVVSLAEALQDSNGYLTGAQVLSVV